MFIIHCNSFLKPCCIILRHELYVSLICILPYQILQFISEIKLILLSLVETH